MQARWGLLKTKRHIRNKDWILADRVESYICLFLNTEVISLLFIHFLSGCGIQLFCLAAAMGHGRRSRGDKSPTGGQVAHGGGQVPQNLERGDCPPDFVMLQNFKHQITCITM